MTGNRIRDMVSAPASPPVPTESLGMLLGQVRSEVVRALERELVTQGVDLRFSQFQALKHLFRDGPMSAGDLARSLSHDRGAMTRLLDQLEARGYLLRQPDAHDRRALRIELTPAGRKLCRQLTGCGDRVMAVAQRSLKAGERAQLHDYLQRVLHTLRTDSEP